MPKVMAVIKNVHFGVGDRGRCALWFDTYVNESCAALQVFTPEQAVEIIEGYGVDDFQKLQGKPCWVNHENNTIHWDSVCKV